MTEGLELDVPEDQVLKIIRKNEPKNLIVIRELLKADKMVQRVVEIRRKLLFGKPKLSAVISPLSLLELTSSRSRSSQWGITIQRLSELYAEAGLVGFKVHARVGGYPIRPSNKALVLLKEHA